MPIFKIVPANDLRRKSPLGNNWQTTGIDPHFSVEMTGGPFPPGRYWLRSVGGKALDLLQSPVVYLDTGEGIVESSRFPIWFVPYDNNEFRAALIVDRPLHGLRFDPTDTAQPQTFSLRSLTLEPFPAESPSDNERALPLKVLINLVRLLPADGGAGGAGRFCFALLEYLPEVMDVRCVIPPHHANFRSRFPWVEFIICNADDNAHLALHLAWCDCYVDPLNALRPTAIAPDVAAIGVILDLQHMRMPWFFSASELNARRREYPYAVGRSNHLIAISHYERENLKDFYDRDDVTVVHLSGFMAEAAGDLEAKGHKPGVLPTKTPERYLVYPAVPWPHKNHETLVQAIGVLNQRGVTIPLVLTNASGSSEGSKRLVQLVELLDVGKIVDRKNFLPEAELHALFRNATGMVFPSLYEGFGIPLVDAMKMDVPVLAAQNTASAEIGQDACAYFSNVENVLAVADDLEHFWKDDALRGELKRKGKLRGQDFSSRKMVDAMAGAIRAAINAKKAGRLPPPAIEMKEPEFSDFSACLLLNRSNEKVLAELRSHDDIHHALAERIGASEIVILLDLALSGDTELMRKLRAVPKLITYNSTKPGALDFAIEDFDLRHNHGQSSMVLSLDTLARCNANDFRRLRDALQLFGGAHGACFQAELQDCAMLPAPSELDRVLGYETRRRPQLAVIDVLLKRDAMGGLKNGTAAFLNLFVSSHRVVQVPQTLS